MAAAEWLLSSEQVKQISLLTGQTLPEHLPLFIRLEAQNDKFEIDFSTHLQCDLIKTHS